MKFLKWAALLLLLLIIVYFLGPHPKAPKFDTQLTNLPAQPTELEQWVAAEESNHQLKPDNQARIIWANDTAPARTPWSVVYLHGFSASQEEGDPIHEEFARRYGCNLYLSRLAEHGIDTSEPLASLTADKLWNTARDAMTIGNQLGDSLILIGTSTGGTLALQLAATYPDRVKALILLSPNIAINDGNAWLLNNPWGLQIAHLVKGDYNVSEDTSALYKQYWNHRYRMEAAVELEELLERTMKHSIFEKVTQPTLLLYYYKDDEHQDPVVKVSAMQRMFRQLGTPASQKMEKALPNTENHVIGSYIKSKDLISVSNACDTFAEKILGWTVANNNNDSPAAVAGQ